MAMTEASASCKSKNQKGLTASNDVVEAVHQQLCDDDNDNHKKKREMITDEEDDVDQARRQSDATSAKINEIFGSDEVVRGKKQKKYRSLESIYMTTIPIIVEDDKNRIIKANVWRNP
ncbi:uncharacterized protein LOC129308095 [Prosopis cineraria]|uniref:uncharacterized protein LOC129308095 n=1 Tax=Prosopis cineraria TaxID=364024 RepID=UPI00240FB441|nr:uncharacterized protein LOC129308095 [Prosopis cineraria]